MVTLQNSDLANSSKEKQLRYVEDFYEFAGQLKGYKPLDDVIADVDLEALGEILEAYFVSIQNQPIVNGSKRVEVLVPIFRL